jgi:phospholipid-binding lipoprotein MlaA
MKLPKPPIYFIGDAHRTPLSASACLFLVALILCSVLALGGCATTRADGNVTAAQRLDPWENWNRKVFSFNESLDKNFLEPVARTYANVVPQMARTGVRNFFGNVNDAWSAVNNFLQLKITDGFSDVIRVGTNTVFGVAGLIDVASDLGFEKHQEDFGQTLGHYGVGAGAYIVLPLLGPSSVRETVALPLDRAVSPALLIHDGTWQYSIVALQLINARAAYLGAGRIVDDIALDKYTFVRDTYLQRRRSLVYDGDPPDPDRATRPEPGDAPPTDSAP